jgi:hypothetical protein
VGGVSKKLFYKKINHGGHGEKNTELHGGGRREESREDEREILQMIL